MFEFAALLKREWLEHRGGFLWTPAVALALLMLAGLVFSAGAGSVELSVQERIELNEKLNPSEPGGHGEHGERSVGEVITAMALDVAGSTDRELQAKMALLLDKIAQPFYWVLLVVSVFAFASCLYDERRDRSVLFFKSMPVGDVSTVLSKYVFVVWCAPLVTVACILAGQLFALTVVSLQVEDGMGSRVWAASGIWLKPVELALGYVLYGLWALPVFAWLMLMSSWAPRIPLLWALGVPFVGSILEGILFDSSRLSGAIRQHLSMHVLPDTSLSGGWSSDLSSQLAVLADPALYTGLAVGALLLGGTIYFRGHRNEI